MLKTHAAIIVCAALVSTTATAGVTRHFVDAHRGCRDGVGTLSLMQEHLPTTDGKFLGKSASEWTDVDLSEYEQIYTECLRLHPAEVMSVLRVGEPIVAPPGAIERKVAQRLNELRQRMIEPARAAQREEKASIAASQAIEIEQEQKRISDERKRSRQAEDDERARQQREATSEQSRRTAMQEQAQRDRDAANQAKALAEREAPLIAATEKEASDAHRARLAAEKALADLRQQVASAQSLRSSEDAAGAASEAKRRLVEQENAQRQSEQREDEALAKRCSVSAEQFERISLGMTLREVRRTFACTGSLASSTEIQGLGAFSVYDWDGTKRGTAAITTFNQGRLVAKSQNALD